MEVSLTRLTLDNAYITKYPGIKLLAHISITANIEHWIFKQLATKACEISLHKATLFIILKVEQLTLCLPRADSVLTFDIEKESESSPKKRPLPSPIIVYTRVD